MNATSTSTKIMVLNFNTGTWEEVESLNHVHGDGKGHIQIFGKVTPELAKKLLERNNNRDIKPAKIDQMARDMKSKKWFLSSDQICFSPNGDLLNGQHRLGALIKSNTAQEFSCMFGCSDEDMRVYDSGTSRSLFDVSKLSEIQLSKFGVGIARFMRRQTIQYLLQRATREEEISFIMEYIDIFRWAEKMFRNPEYKNREVSWEIGNDVGSAFARAYLTYKNIPEKLNRLETLARGLANGEDWKLLVSSELPENSSFGCLNRLLNEMYGNQGQTARNARYRKTEKVILAFVEKIPTKMIKEDHFWEERFLLPCELQAKEIRKIEEKRKRLDEREKELKGNDSVS